MQHKRELSQLKLTELIEEATKYILDQHYAESTISQHTRVWRHLQNFADSHSYKYFSLELSAKFMKEIYGIIDIYRPIDKKERWRIRFILCLDDFSRNKCFVSLRVYNVTPIPEVYVGIHNLYKKYLTNIKQKFRSILTKLSRIKIFLLYLYNHNIFETKEVIPDTIIEFMGTLKYSSAYNCSILLTLRDFLNCADVSKLFQQGLADILNSIKSKRYERLPSFYSNEEIKRILSAVDRNTPQGKKDYSIIILAADLALRVSDINTLQLDENQLPRSKLRGMLLLEFLIP